MGCLLSHGFVVCFFGASGPDGPLAKWRGSAAVVAARRSRPTSNSYRPRTASIPARRRPIFARGSRPTGCSSNPRSRAMTCDTLATESFGRFVIFRGEQHVARCVGPAQIAGQGHADDGSQPAPVEGVALDDDYRPAKPRPGSRGLRQLNPADVTLGDHHSARCRICLAAAVRKPSSSPTSSQTRFIVSVTSSGAWRATYSSRAAAYTSLRDRRARLASRSARAKRSSGIETAVFIPAV